MMDGLAAIIANEVESVAKGAYPLTIGGINLNTSGISAIKQVVSIVSAIVAGNLNFGKVIVLVEHLIGVVKHIGALVGE